MSVAGLTTALGALGGAANIFFGEKQRVKGQDLYDRQLEQLRSGKYDLTLSGAQTQAANLARQYGEQMSRQTGERGMAGQQAAIMAARGGDPRMAAGLGTQVAASDQAVRDAQNQALAGSIGAQQNLANMQQGLLTQNQQFKQGLEGMEMQRGAAAAEAGRHQLMAGMGQMIQAPIMGMQMGAAAHEAKYSPENLNPFSIFNFRKNKGDGTERVRFGAMAHGGKMPKAMNGMVTPGEFSHKKNPIHMIDKNGDKVGEATGGELIFNPEQTEAIENMIESGRSTQLMQYMRELLDQPQFQEEGDVEVKGDTEAKDNWFYRERRKRGYTESQDEMFINLLREAVKKRLDEVNRNRSMEDGGTMPKPAQGISISPAVDAFLNFVMQKRDIGFDPLESVTGKKKGEKKGS
jgi:hypothetical protein